MAASRVARRAVGRLAVTLRYVTPVVSRRVEVPLGLRLDRLHQTIQAVMGWSDYHSYEFRAGARRWGSPNPDDESDRVQPPETAVLGEVLRAVGARRLLYAYDFGDGWLHDLDLEHVAGVDPRATYPRLIEAVGRCPPEDVGGPDGYAEFLEALADPNHGNHRLYLTWCGGSFDPRQPDQDAIRAELEELARQWGQLRTEETAEESG